MERKYVMKTKYRLITTIVLVFTVQNLLPQINYYPTTKTFYEDGYVYQCDIDESGMITLYNKDNSFTYAHYANKDDTRVPSDVLLGRVQLIEDDNWTRSKCGEIANNVFSSSERVNVANGEYFVRLIVNPFTGKVDEVFFRFMYNDPFVTVPMSTFRKLELALKEKIWFTVTPAGKKLKFILRGWRQEVSPTPQLEKPELL